MERSQRVRQDWQELESLAAASSMLRCHVCPGPADAACELEFQWDLDAPQGREASQHQDAPAVCRLMFPKTYPHVPPKIRWRSRMWHPNIDPQGGCSWEITGLRWSSHIRMDEVCHRLWDIARWARYDLFRPSYPAAAAWFAEHQAGRPPMDPRSLRDLAATDHSVVVHYRRQGGRLLLTPLPRPTAAEETGNALLAAELDDAQAARQGIVFLSDERPDQPRSE